MPSTRTIRRSLATGAAGLVAAAGVVAVAAQPGEAQATGTTYTIVSSGHATVANTDVAPRGFARGRFSLGDQLILRQKVVRDGTVAGTQQMTVTVTDARPTAADKAHGLVNGVYHLADGDLYFTGTVLFDDAGTGTGAIIGGTGAYAGARGTVEPGSSRDVIHLLP